MNTIKYSKDDKLWTVGIDESTDTAHRWLALRDCSTKDEAMAWLSYLNGGDYPPYWQGTATSE